MRGPRLAEAAGLHRFQACGDTLYGSGRPILSIVRTSPW
jgi:hypothetical protein